jgi:hypothetical protein
MGYFSASLAAATKNFYDRVDLTLNPPAVGSVTNMPVSGLGAGTDGYYYGGAASPPVDEGGDQCATWTGPVPFTAGAIAYVVHGTTEVNALAPTTASRPVSILELDASTGIDLRSRESGGLPVVASGGHWPCTLYAPPFATYFNASWFVNFVGALSRSTNGRFLTMACFGCAVGSTKDSPAGCPRVVARVSWTGEVDTTTALTNWAAGGGVPSAAVTADGSGYWVGGSSGVMFAPRKFARVPPTPAPDGARKNAPPTANPHSNLTPTGPLSKQMAPPRASSLPLPVSSSRCTICFCLTINCTR